MEYLISRLVQRIDTNYYANIIFKYFVNEKLIKLKKYIIEFIKTITKFNNITKYDESMSIHRSIMSTLTCINYSCILYLNELRVVNSLTKTVNGIEEPVFTDYIAINICVNGAHRCRIDFDIRIKDNVTDRMVSIIGDGRDIVFTYHYPDLQIKNEIDEFSDKFQQRIQKYVKFIKERRK